MFAKTGMATYGLTPDIYKARMEAAYVFSRVLIIYSTNNTTWYAVVRRCCLRERFNLNEYGEDSGDFGIGVTAYNTG